MCFWINLPSFGHAIGVISQYVFRLWRKWSTFFHTGWTMDLFVGTWIYIIYMRVHTLLLWRLWNNLSPYQEKIKIVQFKFLQCIPASWLYFSRLMVCGPVNMPNETNNSLWSRAHNHITPEFRGNKDLLSFHHSLLEQALQCCPNLLFIQVDPCTINMAVACTHCNVNCITYCTLGRLPRATTKLK